MFQEVVGGDPKRLGIAPSVLGDLFAARGVPLERRVGADDPSPEVTDSLGELHRRDVWELSLQLGADVVLGDEEILRHKLVLLGLQLCHEVPSFVGGQREGDASERNGDFPGAFAAHLKELLGRWIGLSCNYNTVIEISQLYGLT